MRWRATSRSGAEHAAAHVRRLPPYGTSPVPLVSEKPPQTTDRSWSGLTIDRVPALTPDPTSKLTLAWISTERPLASYGCVPEAELQFAEIPARYRSLDSRDAAHWIDGGAAQSSPSFHLDRIPLPSLAAENPDTGSSARSRSQVSDIGLPKCINLPMPAPLRRTSREWRAPQLSQANATK
jgi:hypothetical protein